MVPDFVERFYVDRKRRLHQRRKDPANCEGFLQDNGENERRYERDLVRTFHYEASTADKSASASCRF